MRIDEPHGVSASPAPSPTNIFHTLRSEGLGWALRRVRYRTPATRPGRAVHSGLRFLLGLLRTPARRAQRVNNVKTVASDDTLYAFYDLQVLPITFDAAWFAVAADLARRQLGLAHIHFVIVPGTRGFVREERAAVEAATDAVARMWKLHNIVVPIFTLLPTTTGFTVLPSRAAASAWCHASGARVYPRLYDPGLPVGYHPTELFDVAKNDRTAAIGVLRAPPQAVRYVERWSAAHLRGRRLVTITLRDYDFMAARNSNTAVWAEFARRLPSSVYLPVFVPDTERALDALPPELAEAQMFSEASWNLGLRMALYERSFLNLGVNCGPLFMSVLNAEMRVLIFRIVTPSVPQTSEAFLRQLGYEIGGQLPFATPFQRLIWENDSLEVIEREFFAMVERIDRA